MPGSRRRSSGSRKPSNRPNGRPRRVLPIVEEDAERREKRREKNRVRQKIYRERQRTIAEDRKNNRGNAEERETTPESYIPVHQINAINDFFDRLRRVETVLQVCCTCNDPVRYRFPCVVVCPVLPLNCPVVCRESPRSSFFRPHHESARPVR